MKKSYALLTVVLALLITSCATVGRDINVTAQSDPKVNFSGYETYSWAASAQILYDSKGKWEPRGVDLDSEVMMLIEREMAKRGVVRNDVAPEILIGFAAGIDMDALELGEDPETQLTILKNIPKGALSIVFVDTSTGFTMWAATAGGNVLEEPDDDLARKRLAYAVKKMFQKLP